jgi:PEP-CTERM motif
MKQVLIVGLMAILFAASPAMASVKSFTFKFAGNGATASGMITFDLALLKNPGRNLMDTTATGVYSPHGINIPGLVTALSLKVSGASVGNGTYLLNDFEAILFDTSLVGVNLNQQLVGQSLVNVGSSGETWSWGTNQTILGSDPVQSYTGDFQLFSPAISSAPYGSAPFQLTTAGGEDMQLTSFAAVPEPSTWLLISLGLGGLVLLRRRQKA